MAEPLRGAIVLPAFNEAETLGTTIPQLREVLRAGQATDGPLQDCHWRVLLVDDGSTDQTLAVCDRLVRQLSGPGFRIEVLPLLRNFGHQGAMITGMLEASREADLVVAVDADGEQPFSLITQMVKLWREGAPIVHSVREPSLRLSWYKRASSSTYYRLISLLSGIRISPGMSDFKLWDGALLREVAPYLPTCGSIRVFAAWLAPHGCRLPYRQSHVPGRKSRFSPRRMLDLGLGGVFPYTALPLRMSLVFGTLMIGVSLAELAIALISHYLGRTVPGWTSLIVICSFFGGANAIMLGLLSEYLVQIIFKSRFPIAVPLKARRRPASEQKGLQG